MRGWSECENNTRCALQTQLTVRAAKIVVYVNVASGHSHCSGLKRRFHDPCSLQNLLCQAKLQTTERRSQCIRHQPFFKFAAQFKQFRRFLETATAPRLLPRVNAVFYQMVPQTYSPKLLHKTAWALSFPLAVQGSREIKKLSSFHLAVKKKTTKPTM